MAEQQPLPAAVQRAIAARIRVWFPNGEAARVNIQTETQKQEQDARAALEHWEGIIPREIGLDTFWRIFTERAYPKGYQAPPNIKELMEHVKGMPEDAMSLEARFTLMAQLQDKEWVQGSGPSDQEAAARVFGISSGYRLLAEAERIKSEESAKPSRRS